MVSFRCRVYTLYHVILCGIPSLDLLKRHRKPTELEFHGHLLGEPTVRYCATGWDVPTATLHSHTETHALKHILNVKWRAAAERAAAEEACRTICGST